MGTGGNEYSVAIPPGALDVQIALQDATHTMKVYTAGVGNSGSPANYWLIEAGQVLSIRSKLGGQTLYFMSTTSSVAAQVLYIIDP